MLSAPDSWWDEKAQVEPSILRYQDARPIHLDLLQKVFGGTTANGFHMYISSFGDTLLGGDNHLEAIHSPDIEEVGDTQQAPNVEEVEEEQETVPNTSNRLNVTKLRARKCLRDRKCKRINQSDEFTTTVSFLNDIIRENMVVLRGRGEEACIIYNDVIDLLKGLPGFTYDDVIYLKGVRVLEDKTRRIAFVKISDGSAKAVSHWLATFLDV